MTAQGTLFDQPRHIVVRARRDDVGQVVHTDAEVAKFLATNPDGCVVYDAGRVGVS